MLANGQSGLLSSLTGFVNGFLGTVVDIMLVQVYLFLLLEFRTHLLSALLKGVPQGQRDNVQRLTREAGWVAQQYLLGWFS
jgi:predicted PurR-regulated permease PerM